MRTVWPSNALAHGIASLNIPPHPFVFIISLVSTLPQHVVPCGLCGKKLGLGGEENVELSEHEDS